MTDLVTRLRQHNGEFGNLVEEATHEIERLMRERDEWKERWAALAQANLIMALEQFQTVGRKSRDK